MGRRGGSGRATSRLYLGYISGISRLYLGYISGTSPGLREESAAIDRSKVISAISRLYLGYISGTSPGLREESAAMDRSKVREEAHVVEALGHDGEACGGAQLALIN